MIQLPADFDISLLYSDILGIVAPVVLFAFFCAGAYLVIKKFRGLL